MVVLVEKFIQIELKFMIVLIMMSFPPLLQSFIMFVLVIFWPLYQVTRLREYQGVDPHFDNIARQYHDIVQVTPVLQKYIYLFRTKYFYIEISTSVLKYFYSVCPETFFIWDDKNDEGIWGYKKYTSLINVKLFELQGKGTYLSFQFPTCVYLFQVLYVDIVQKLENMQWTIHQVEMDLKRLPDKPNT